MEEALSVKEQDFTIIKEKIIKTNDLIVLYKEANDKLIKSKSRANQAIKQLKEKNESLTQEVSNLKFHNERLVDNLERCQIDEKEKELTNLKAEYAKIEQKYQENLIESQLTITDLQGQIKECSCDTNLTPWSPSRKVTAHEKIRELKVLCNEFREAEQKWKTEINSLNKKNHTLEKKIFALTNPKPPRRRDMELGTVKAKLEHAQASLQNHQQTIKSLKQQHSKEISLLQKQLNLLILDNDKLKIWEAKYKGLKGELFKLQGLEKSDVCTQTENAPIGRCEENSDVEDEDLTGIFSEMICRELMLSPMSRSGQSLSENVAPITLIDNLMLEKEIPNIVITPPTPGIDVKESSLALHAIMQTTSTNAVSLESSLTKMAKIHFGDELRATDVVVKNSISNSIPLDHFVNKMAINFGGELTATDVQVKNSITIPVLPEDSPENPSNERIVYFDDDVKIADAELRSQRNSTPKQKSPKRLIKNDRRRKKFWMPYPMNALLKTRRKNRPINRPEDTILNAIQILQKNNVNFTITNESPYNRLPPVKVEPVAHTRPVFPQTFNPSVANFALREIPVHVPNIYTCPLDGVNLNVAENVQEALNRTKTVENTSVRVHQETRDEFVHNDKILKNNLKQKAQIVAKIDSKPRISTKLSPSIDINNSTIDNIKRTCLEERFSNTEKSSETFIHSDLITKHNDDAYKELEPIDQSLNISSILDFDISSDEEVVQIDGKEEITCKGQVSIAIYPEINSKENDGQLLSDKEITNSSFVPDINAKWHVKSYSNVQFLNSQRNAPFSLPVKSRIDRPPKILVQEQLGFSSQMKIEQKTFLERTKESGSYEKEEITSNKETELNVPAQDPLTSSKVPLIVVSKLKEKKDRKPKSERIAEDVADGKTANLDLNHTESKDHIGIDKLTVSPIPNTVASRVKRKREENSKPEDKTEFINEDNNLDSVNEKRNSDTTGKSPKSAFKRKKSTPAKLKCIEKLQSSTSHKSDEELGTYLMKNINIVRQEFMTGEETGSEAQNIQNINSHQSCNKSELTKETYPQNTEIFNHKINKTKSHTNDPGTQSSTGWSANLVIKPKEELIFTEKTTGSNQPCGKSDLTTEICSQNSPDTNVFDYGPYSTNLSSTDPGTYSSIDWCTSLDIKQALCDDFKLKDISKRLDHIPYVFTCHLGGSNRYRAKTVGKNVTEGKLLNDADYIAIKKTAPLNLKKIESKDNIDVSKLTPPQSPTAQTVVSPAKRWRDRISKVEDRTEFNDNVNDLNSLSHKTNSNIAIKCATPVVKRKRGRPPKIKTIAHLETDALDTPCKGISKYVAKNKRFISKEFITDDESDSDSQESLKIREVSVSSEENTKSDQDCTKSELTIENCILNNEGANKTGSSAIDTETHSPTSWCESLSTEKHTLCDDIELKQMSNNNFERFKTKYKEKIKVVSKKRSPQNKLSQTLPPVPKHPEEWNFKGFNDSEREAANSLRLSIFRQNMELFRQICEKSNEVESLNSMKNKSTNDNKINIVQDILITKKNAIDLISGTTVTNNQKPTLKKSVPPTIDILTQLMEEMSKTGPAQKTGKMFIERSPVYTPAVYSTPAKRKTEEVEKVQEGFCEEDELYDDWPRPPDEVMIRDQSPKLIPTKKVHPMKMQEVANAINKLLSFGHEAALVNEVAMQFAFETNYFIAQVVVGKISQNCDKPDNSFPPSPPLSSVQRILLGFLIKLEKSTHPNILDKVLEMIEPQVFNKPLCTIETAQQLTRFYTAICRMRQDLNRIRRFICDSFYFSGDFAVPVLFAALTMWPNVLPMASQLSEFPLAKVIVHICYLKLCNKPGYNLLPLRDLLSRYYGYPTERWNCDELFQEILVDYIRNPAVKLSDYTLQLFLKNKPAPWVSNKVHDCLIPLYKQVPETNPNLKATLLILYGNIYHFFKKHELQFVTKIDQWFEDLQQEEKDPVVERSLIIARQRLLKCKMRSTNKNEVPEPDKKLHVIEVNVDNSKVQ